MGAVLFRMYESPSLVGVMAPQIFADRAIMLASPPFGSELPDSKKTSIRFPLEDDAIDTIVLIGIDKTFEPPTGRSENAFFPNALIHAAQDFVLYDLPLSGVISHKVVAVQTIILTLNYCRAEFFDKEKTLVRLFLENEASGAVVIGGLPETAKLPTSGNQVLIELFPDGNYLIVTDKFKQVLPSYSPVAAGCPVRSDPAVIHPVYDRMPGYVA